MMKRATSWVTFWSKAAAMSLMSCTWMAVTAVMSAPGTGMAPPRRPCAPRSG